MTSSVLCGGSGMHVYKSWGLGGPELHNAHPLPGPQRRPPRPTLLSKCLLVCPAVQGRSDKVVSCRNGSLVTEPLKTGSTNGGHIRATGLFCFRTNLLFISALLP